jgi:WD40 repeat protein
VKTFWKKRGAYLWDPTFSRDGKLLAVGEDAVEDSTQQGSGGRVRLYDMEKLEELPSLRGHGDVVNSVAFSPDGRTLVSGSWDRQIKIWDLRTGEERMTMRSPVLIPYRLQFALGGQVLIVRDFGNNVITWRALRQPAGKGK